MAPDSEAHTLGPPRSSASPSVPYTSHLEGGICFFLESERLVYGLHKCDQLSIKISLPHTRDKETHISAIIRLLECGYCFHSCTDNHAYAHPFLQNILPHSILQRIPS